MIPAIIKRYIEQQIAKVKRELKAYIDEAIKGVKQMGSSSRGGSDSRSETKETQLSKQQASILKEREAQYQEHFFPEMIEELKAADAGTMESTYMQGQTKAINNSSAEAQSTFTNAMNQRELTGTGTEAQGIVALSSAKSSALADAYYKTKVQGKQDKLNVLQMGGAMSPTPTTAAPMGQESTGSSSQKRWGILS